jgi:hypothetical protein
VESQPAPVLWRRVLLSVVALAVVAGLTWLGWTWRHPHAFEDAGGWGVGADHKKVGETLYVGMSYAPRDATGEVTLDGGEANVVSGADVAETALLLCTLEEPAEVGAIGSYVGDTIHEDCASLEPIEDERMGLNATPRQQVVLAVTLTERGTVHIRDVDLAYGHGWQRGTQRIGGEVFMSTDDLPEDYYP